MGKWVIPPGQVHHHNLPQIGHDEMREADGAVWGCDCGARFRYRFKYSIDLEMQDGTPAMAGVGEWSADHSTFTIKELMGWED